MRCSVRSRPPSFLCRLLRPHCVDCAAPRRCGHLAASTPTKIYTAPDAPAARRRRRCWCVMAASLQRGATNARASHSRRHANFRVPRRRGDGRFPEQPRSFHGAALGRCGARSPRRELAQAARGHAHAIRRSPRCSIRVRTRPNTVAIRARIEKGEVRGPRIFTVGLAAVSARRHSVLHQRSAARACSRNCISRARGRGARGGPRRTSPPAPMAPSCSCTPRRART